MENLTLYCNCIPNQLAKQQQFDQINLVCNSQSLEPHIRQDLQKRNYQFDDTGDNISHLNSLFGDLTGLYWVWKNTDHTNFIGTNQYRRFWNEKEIKLTGLRSNTVYVYPIQLDIDILKQLILNHGTVLPLLLHEAAQHGKIDMSVDTVLGMRNINCVYACNMFFCERPLFDRICQKFFEIIMEIYQGSRYALPHIDPGMYRNKRGSQRLMAFLAERIMTLMLVNKQYYFGNIDIQPINVRVV